MRGVPKWPLDPQVRILAAMERTHLGWDRMPLELAAEWLKQRFGDRMDGVLVALPGAWAGRILAEPVPAKAPQNSKLKRNPRIQVPEDGLPGTSFDQYCRSGIRLIPWVSCRR